MRKSNIKNLLFVGLAAVSLFSYVFLFSVQISTETASSDEISWSLQEVKAPATPPDVEVVKKVYELSRYVLRPLAN